jgi:hypothetical protein
MYSKIPVEVRETEGAAEGDSNIIKNQAGAEMWASAMKVGAATKVDNAGNLCIGCEAGSNPFALTVADQEVCSSSLISDLIVTGNNIKWYATATGGTPLAPATVLSTLGASPLTLYVTHTNNSGSESPRASVVVTLNTCPPATEDNIEDYTLAAPYCLACGGDNVVRLTTTGLDEGSRVFKFYAAATGGSPYYTGNVGYTVDPVADLGITGNVQGGYFTAYVTVSDATHTESARKEVVIAGSKLPVFADYNLGADVTMLNQIIVDNPNINSPAKAAMKYLADKVYSTLAELQTDGHVFGGRFQWGREWNSVNSTTTYPINTSTYVLYSAANKAAALAAGATYDSYGQIETYNGSTSATDLHVYSSSTYKNDWRTTKDDKLWGNGFNMITPTVENSGVKYNGQWYQSQLWWNINITDYDVSNHNNPCPSGWRVPTQDEWERIADYECKPRNTLLYSWDPAPSGNFGTLSPNSGGKAFTWVPGGCDNGVCLPNNSGIFSTSDAHWGSPANTHSKTGYAVYRTSDWLTYTSGIDLLTFDKEPYLFLPATGNRTANDGTVTSVGTYGYYWSSTPNGTGGRYLGFANSFVSTNSYDSRGSGKGVRCVAQN